MALSVFDDKTCSPHQTELLKALGPARTLWDELKHQMVSHFSPIQEEWVFSGKITVGLYGFGIINEPFYI